MLKEESSLLPNNNQNSFLINMDTINAICSVFTLYNKIFVELKQYSTLSIMAACDMVAAYDQSNVRVVSDPKLVPDSKILADAVYWWKYAAATFGWQYGLGYQYKKGLGGLIDGLFGNTLVNNEKVLCESCMIQTEDIIVASWHGKLFTPGYYIALDHSSKSIVVAIRGSFELRDAIIDLTAESVNFFEPTLSSSESDSDSGFESDLNPNDSNIDSNIDKTNHVDIKTDKTNHVDIKNDKTNYVDKTKHLDKTNHVDNKVHKGMLDAAFNVKKLIDNHFKQTLEKFPDYQIIVTGHSLGAAVAAILTIWWATEYGEKINIHAFCYGCPPVLSIDLAKKYSQYITTFINGNDCIPYLSYGSVDDLKFKLLQILEQSPGFFGRIFQACHIGNPFKLSNDTVKKMENFFNTPAIPKIIPIENPNNMQRLWVPGEIIHLCQKNKDTALINILEPAQLSNIYLTNGMFKDHMPDQYEYALNSAYKQTSNDDF